jgi:hypothetical protein
MSLTQLGLGRTCGQSGDSAKSRAAYQDFLTLWKVADPDMPILKLKRSTPSCSKILPGTVPTHSRIRRNDVGAMPPQYGSVPPRELERHTLLLERGHPRIFP